MKAASAVRKVVTHRPNVVLHVSYTEESRIKSALWLVEQALELKLSGLNTDSGFHCVSLNLLALQFLLL